MQITVLSHSSVITCKERFNCWDSSFPRFLPACIILNYHNSSTAISGSTKNETCGSGFDALVLLCVCLRKPLSRLFAVAESGEKNLSQLTAGGKDEADRDLEGKMHATTIITHKLNPFTGLHAGILKNNKNRDFDEPCDMFSLCLTQFLMMRC